MQNNVLITFKYKRPTDKEHGHTEIFVGQMRKYIGYIIPSRSLAEKEHDNWFFCGAGDYWSSCFTTRSRPKMIETLQIVVNNREKGK